MAKRKVLSGYTVFVDGVDYVGVASGFTPPTIESAVVPSDSAGHGGPFAIQTGRLAELEAMVSMADAFPSLESLVANPAAVNTPVLFTAALTDGEEQRTVEYELSGAWTKQERSEFAGPEGGAGSAGGGGGERGPCTYTISCRVLTHRIDGAEVRHVDLEQNIHRVNGTDVNEQLRTALRSGNTGAGAPIPTSRNELTSRLRGAVRDRI